ncbi:hypothetical protein [Hydrogenophaga sp. MI9]|uniref:hypothetical protein n=1 Tax=Hydrogenophaga sp. MI9 TaxID=3453719 RepID=UPI003EE89AD2
MKPFFGAAAAAAALPALRRVCLWGALAATLGLAACGGGAAADSPSPVAESKTQGLTSQQAGALAGLNRQTLAAAAIDSDTGTAPAAAPERKAFVKVTMYRFYNTRTGAHFYTVSTTERDNIQATLPYFTYEGAAYEVYGQAAAGLSPVYRFFNRNTGTHLYTISETEKSAILANYPYFSLDGVAFYASTTQQSGMRPVYRFYQTVGGFHFYTASETEKNSLLGAGNGYSLDGPAYYIPVPQITCTPPLVPNSDGTACVNPPPTLPAGSYLDNRLTGRWQYITTFLDGTQYGSFYTFGANGYFDYTLIYKGPTASCIAFRQAVAYHQGSYGVVGSISDAANAGRIYLLDTANYVEYTRCNGVVERVPWQGSQPHFHWAGFSGGLLYTNHTDDAQVANTGNLGHVKTQ